MAFTSSQSFEPRVGTAQLIFGVIYSLITLIALSLAFYVVSDGGEATLHYFMAALFAIMAIKSFIIYKRFDSLIRTGVYYEAEVTSCEPIRGITVIRGTCDVPNYGEITIEARLVGEHVSTEIKAYLAEHKQHKLPALLVGVNTKRPRGMFTVKSRNGHLIAESAQLKSQCAASVASVANATSTANAASSASASTAEPVVAPAQDKTNPEPTAAPDANPAEIVPAAPSTAATSADAAPSADTANASAKKEAASEAADKAHLSAPGEDAARDSNIMSALAEVEANTERNKCR